jgi:hypothetical protein
MRVRTRPYFAGIAIVAVIALTACNRTPSASERRSTSATSSQNAPNNNAQTQAGSGQPAVQKISVQTTTVPANGCDWIPAAEVEAIVGKLAKPPEETDDCKYTLVMPEAIRAAREDEIRIFEANASKNEVAAFLAKTDRELYSPEKYAVTLKVDLNGGLEIQLASAAIAKRFAAEFGNAASAGRAPGGVSPKTPEGWDEVEGIPYGVTARVGHLRINVNGESPDVPKEPMLMLAAQVRDRIPDLPFPAQNTNQPMVDIPPNADVCGLLTRAEAEAVLGPLVVNPYRSSSYFPPLAHAAGNSCAYFTAGHHVFVLTPTWFNGARTFALEKGIGGLIAKVMPQQAVIMKGPWDKSQITSSGKLDFLKKDQLLDVNFVMSSTDRIGALKLATTAMQRLAAVNIDAKAAYVPVRAAPGAGGTAPGWNRIVRLNDGRMFVTDGVFMLDAALAKPATLPKDEASTSALMGRLLSAQLPNEISISDLKNGPQAGTYAGPDDVIFNADYIDYVRHTLPADHVKIRMGGHNPAVILLDGKPVGIIMPRG